MNPQRLTPNLRQLRGLFDWTRPVVHVALTARREPDSGLVSCLKKSERAQPERQHCEQSPGARCAKDHQEDHEQRGCSERDESESTPLRLTAWSDIRDDGDASAS
jgi:hypothetical protein